MGDRITKFGELLRREKGAAPLDDDHDGEVDAGEGAVVERCGERFFIEAEDFSFSLNANGRLHIPPNHLRLPYEMDIVREETMASLRAKLAATSPLGMAAVSLLTPAEPTAALSVNFNRDFRSHEIFAKTAWFIPRELPHIAEHRHFTALYPASGSHLAPLATFFELIDQGVIDGGELIMTEIDPAFGNMLEENLTFLRDSKIIDGFCELEKKQPGRSPESSIRYFEMDYKGKPVTILFAVKNCGNNYYRNAYFELADAIFLHDVDAGWKGNAELLSKIFRDRRREMKPKVVLVENETDPIAGIRVTRDLTFLNHIRLAGGYGHYGASRDLDEKEDIKKVWKGVQESGHPQYHSALLLLPDQPLLEGLSEEETDTAIRLATLWADAPDSDFVAPLNHSECTEFRLRFLSGNGDFFITGEKFLKFLEVVEKWLRLPEDILPRQKKEIVALRLLGYLQNEFPPILGESEWDTDDGEKKKIWREFYASHGFIYAVMKGAVQKHPEVLRKMKSKTRVELMKFLTGLPPPTDFGLHWRISEGIKQMLANGAAPSSTSQTVANPETAVRR